jgi:putative ABC transport system permease protein
MLGIAIGVAAVVCTAALGQASAARVQAQIDSLGEDFLWVRAGSLNVGGARSGWGSAQTLTDDDAAAIAAYVPDITMCSPVMQGRQQIGVPGSNWNTVYQGVLPSYFTIRRRIATSGSLFVDADEAEGSRVIVIGTSAAQNLFGTDDPVGKIVRMNGFPWRVIGVLDAIGADANSVDRDDVVFVPFSAAYHDLNRVEWITDIMCAVDRPDRMDAVETEVSALLRTRHELPSEGDDDFTIQKPLSIIEMRAQTSRTLALMLTSIGAVSLVIAGVGIMNIMLVSVAERSREIGVRMAIGARQFDIRLQFLLEAALLGLLGGAAGVGLGWLGAHAVSAIFTWPTIVTRQAVTIATASACGAGILFGYFPAHLASNLDPIEAIRDEK